MTKKIIVGQIKAAYGLQGQFKIKSFTENPEDIFLFDYVSIGSVHQNISLKKIGSAKKDFIVSSDPSISRNQVELIIKENIFINRDMLPVSGESFYFEDLISSNVISQNKNSIGIVISVQNYGASDLLEVQSSTNNKNHLIPFTKETVVSVDIKKKLIVLKDIEGYLFE